MENQGQTPKILPNIPNKARFIAQKNPIDIILPTRLKKVGDTGLEQNSEETSQVTNNKGLSDSLVNVHKPVRVQNPVHILDLSPDLDTVVKAWAELPEHVKQTISTLVDASKKK